MFEQYAHMPIEAQIHILRHEHKCSIAILSRRFELEREQVAIICGMSFDEVAPSPAEDHRGALRRAQDKIEDLESRLATQAHELLVVRHRLSAADALCAARGEALDQLKLDAREQDHKALMSEIEALKAHLQTAQAQAKGAEARMRMAERDRMAAVKETVAAQAKLSKTQSTPRSPKPKKAKPKIEASPAPELGAWSEWMTPRQIKASIGVTIRRLSLLGYGGAWNAYEIERSPKGAFDQYHYRYQIPKEGESPC